MFDLTAQELPAMLTAKNLQDLLPVSRSAVYALLRDPTFPTIRLGRRILIPRDEMLRWFENILHRNDPIELVFRASAVKKAQ